MLGGSIALYRKIDYRLFEQVGLPQSSQSLQQKWE